MCDYIDHSPRREEPAASTESEALGTALAEALGNLKAAVPPPVLPELGGETADPSLN